MSSRLQRKQNPTKIFYRIGEVSRITGLEPYVLRYWETEFPIIRPNKGNGRQRLYSEADLDNILLVKRLLYEEGYTIAGAKKRLSDGRGADHKAVIESIKTELREILEILR